MIKLNFLTVLIDSVQVLFKNITIVLKSQRCRKREIIFCEVMIIVDKRHKPSQRDFA